MRTTRNHLPQKAQNTQNLSPKQTKLTKIRIDIFTPPLPSPARDPLAIYRSCLLFKNSEGGLRHPVFSIRRLAFSFFNHGAKDSLSQPMPPHFYQLTTMGQVGVHRQAET